MGETFYIDPRRLALMREEQAFREALVWKPPPKPAEPKPEVPAFVPTPGLAPAGVAAEFLLTILADGPVPARVVIDRAKQAGISKRTLDRAKEALKIRSIRDAVKGWFWRLGGK